MVRPFFRSALVILAAGGALASAAPHAGAARAASLPPTQVGRPVCTTSIDDPQARTATFTVRSSRGPDATDFGFTAALQEKPAGGSWTTLTGAASPAGFGTYQPATEGVAAMVRRIRVNGLRLGSAYRLKVTFRWATPTGTRRAVRRSAPCTVKELRPNAGVIRALPWTPGTRGDQVVYRPQLRLQRVPPAWATRTFTISVIQGATLLGQAKPQPLYNGGLALIPGTRCTPGQTVTYRIEISGPPVEESNAADNELTVPCTPGR